MSKKRILLVDDDVELCEEITEILRDEGHIVNDTSDSLEGSKLCEKNEFDVIILDYKMPELTGIDLLRKIRKQGSKAKIFLVTGRPFIEKLLAEEKVSHMVDHVIAKPVDVDDFLEKIANS